MTFLSITTNDVLLFAWTKISAASHPGGGGSFDLYQNITIYASNFYDMNLITFLSIYTIKQLPDSLLSA
jgi:hypothetical protein